MPFSVVGSLGSDYWDWLEQNLDNCGSDAFLFIYKTIFNRLLTSLTCAVVSLVLAVLYYLLRPAEDNKFKYWWRRGKWVKLVIVMCTVISCVSTYFIFTLLLTTYVSPTSRICVHWNDQYVFYPTATFTIASVVISFVLML